MRVLRYVRGTKEPEEIDISELADAIDPENAVVWIDTDDPNDAERDDVMRRLDVSPLVVEALTNPKPERTKLIRYGEYFHVAVHDCEMQGDDLESREIDVVIGPGWLVTVRHASELPTSRPVDIDEVARRFDIMRSEHDATEEGFLLWALFDVVIDRYFDVNDVIDDAPRRHRGRGVQRGEAPQQRDPPERHQAPEGPRGIPPRGGADA